MSKDVLSIAWRYMKRRRFALAIRILEGRSEIYEENFEYYLMLGTACLYAGDIGNATMYYQKARKIKLTDTRLLLGQAAIFLRRGETDRALQYYLEARENNPSDKICRNAISFIKSYGDYETICRWVDSGRITQFYPPLGANPDKIIAFSSVAAGILVLVFAVSLFLKKADVYNGPRLDLSELELSSDEKINSQEKDLSSGTYNYILSDKDITRSYENALNYFQLHRDNKAQVEINRILNSNASVQIKQKANVLMGYLVEPTFDSLTDNPSYTEFYNEKPLYLDCWVAWGGRVSDAVESESGKFTCRLLVGYEKMRNVEGIIDVVFDVNPEFAPDQPVKILGKISNDGGHYYLKGKAVFQSVHDGLE